MMEFTFGKFGDPAKNFGIGFSSQNIGKTRILGTEAVIAGQGSLGPVEITILAGYTFIDPRALNWDKPLTLVNYLGDTLKNSNSITGKGSYNQANLDTPNNPFSAISYGMTSTSSTNILKYRNRHTFKFDFTIKFKGIEWNTNLQYSSYQENVDYAFISPVFKTIGGTAFGGLEQFRKNKEAIPIGQGRGDIVWNMHWAYNFKQGVRIAFIVKNLLNWEYTPRPAYLESPRSYTIQLSYLFGGFAKKKTAE
jgi:iron complex outermembrane receptor protein